MGFLEDSNATDQFDRTEVVVGDRNDRNKKQAVDAQGSAQVGIADPSGVKISSTSTDSKTTLDTSIISGYGPISSVNSSSTNLAANATFTGQWEDVSKYGSVSITIHSSHNSAINGVKIEYSTDGVNVDLIHQYTQDVSTLPSGGAALLPLKTKYFRMVYTNGNQATTFFRMQVMYGPFPAGPTNMIATEISDSSSALIARSVIVGKTSAGGGGYINVKVNPSGTLETNANQTDHDNLNANANIQVGNADVTSTNRVPVTDVLNLAFITAEKTSTSTASIARVGAANLVGRKAIEIVNTSTVVLYVGSSTVTTSGATRGRPIDPKSSFAVDLAGNVDLYIISASNATYVVTEVG